jgi:hypothetical protein
MFGREIDGNAEPECDGHPGDQAAGAEIAGCGIADIFKQ